MMRNKTLGAALLAVVGTILAIATTVALQAQRTMMSDRPISPSVLASFLTRGDQLVLLVLWRGSPGWFWRVDGGAGSGGGSGDQMFQQIGAGGLTFRIEYDFRTDSATVQGNPISLSQTNVVLVDNVDAPAGPVVVATERTDPRVSEPLHPETDVIRRHADLYQYLQCDVPLPSSSDAAAPLKESMLAVSCGRMRP
jgi:hypothetical protein